MTMMVHGSTNIMDDGNASLDDSDTSALRDSIAMTLLAWLVVYFSL